MAMAAHNVFTINHESASLVVRHRRAVYAVGFRKAVEARKVMYDLAAEPEVALLRTVDIATDVQGIGRLVMDVEATLFIAKRDPWRLPSLPLLPHRRWHVGEVKDADFMTLPLKAGVGIVLPTRLLDEDAHEYVFRASVVDPLPR